MKIAVWAGVVALGLGSPAAAETWEVFSHSPVNAFMADTDSISIDGDVTAIRVATVPRSGDPGDASHLVETYEFRCSSGQWRTAGVIEYGADGSEAGRYPEQDAAWEPLRQNTLPQYLNEIVCDGAHMKPPHWPSIRAFVEAGRPQ